MYYYKRLNVIQWQTDANNFPCFLGWIYDSTGDYNLAFIIAGGVSLFGACTVCVAVLIRAVIQCDTTVKDEKEHNNLHP